MDVEDVKEESAPRRADRVWIAFVALVVLGQIALLWRPAYLPTNDGPAHLYSSWVSHRLATDPHDPLARWFVENPRAIYPNAGYAECLEAMAHWLPIRTAERLAVSLYFVALPLAVGALARALRRDPVLPSLFASGLSFSWIFFLGFFNFLWGVPVALVYLAIVRRLLVRWSWRDVLLANALLALAFWFHLVAFASALLGTGALVLVRRRLVPAVAAALPVLLVAPFFWPSSVGAGAAWVWAHSVWQHVEGGLTLSVASAFGGAERNGAIAAGLAILFAAVVGLVRERRGRAEVVLLAGVFVLGAMLAPESVGVGSVLPERLALLAWLFLGLGLDLGRGRMRLAGAALLTLGIVLHAGFLERRFREFDATMKEYLAGTEVVPSGANLYVLTRVPKAKPYVVRPLATASVYYALELDTPSFDVYQAAPENYRLFPVTFTLAARERFLGEKRVEDLPVLELSRWADYLVLWQPIPRLLDRLERRGGYHVILQREDLTVLAHSRTHAAAKGVD